MTPILYEIPDKNMLSRRETDILKQTIEGLANKQIGVLLSISEKTVKNHMAAIFVKFNVQSRTELTTKAFRAGLVT
jgi:DNA-binding NarL/FixJ family response regulator